MDEAPLSFWILMAMVFIWFVMVSALFRILKSRHPSKFREMGEPSLFWNNSMKTGWATARFLFRREHKDLDDSTLSLLSDSMLVFIVTYLVLFLGLTFGLFPNASITARP